MCQAVRAKQSSGSLLLRQLLNTIADFPIDLTLPLVKSCKYDRFQFSYLNIQLYLLDRGLHRYSEIVKRLS
jgi:transposase-like protein